MKIGLSKKANRVLQKFVDKNGKVLMYIINPRSAVRDFLGGQPYYVLTNLKRSGYIKTQTDKNNTKYVLTQKGKRTLNKTLLREKIKDQKWDGKWRILIFDIPESKRNYRSNTRNVLREIGFYRLQASVWVCPYDVISYLYELLPGFREGDWFEYIEAHKISSELKIKKHFNLA